ncbi:MAG: ORF6N domain-containing protein [Bacteroidales bacterium]|nr:ORF6N domain-containing protein [Bacteroidales bacterium]
MSDNQLQPINIENKILVIRGQQVMLDRDLAELYGVETKRLNEQVKRNIERFPEEFMFQITRNELETVKSHFATSPNNMFAGQEGGTRKLPYAFTEHGVTMLSSVLKSETAVKASIQIVKTFVAMRHFLQNNAQIFAELKSMRQHQIETDIKVNDTNRRIDELFDRMDKYAIDDTQGIFFQGQIFDAYAKFESFIQSATKEIVLIDNYVDLSVLERLTKKQHSVNVTIYTKSNTPLSGQDILTFNAQYISSFWCNLCL